MTKYTHNREAFRALVLNSPSMQAHMLARAERGAAAARAAAAGHTQTGEYEASFEAEVHANAGADGKRAEGIVRNNDPNAAAIEFGHVTKNGRPVDGLHTLTRALGAMGGK